MHAAWFSPEIFPVCILGMAGFLLGLFEVAVRMGRHQRIWIGLATILTMAMALLTAAAYYDDQPVAIWLPPFLVATAGSVFLAARLTCLRNMWQAVQWLTKKRSLQWAVFLFAGPCAGLAWACYLEYEGSRTAVSIHDDMDPFDRSDLCEVSPSPAVTDTGRRIQIFALAKTRNMPALIKYDKNFMADSMFDQRILRLAGPDARTNCFGWVFTGGRFWIRKSEDVEAILHDNGYREASAPQPGDLAVYRGPEARLSHVGIIRLADEEDLVLVESKWSWLGLYLHRPEDQCYGMDCTYYRSPRGSHLLRGLDSASQTMALTVSSSR